MDIKVILTSTVIATLITGCLTLIWNLINQRVGNSLKYITEERKNWRSDFREIIYELESCEHKDIKKVLSKVKCRINTFGLCNEDDISQDGHIWKAVLELETCDNDKAFVSKKEALINYLCALIKFDWERAKREAKRSTYSILSSLLITLASLSYAYSISFFYLSTSEGKENNTFAIIFRLIASVFVFVVPYATMHISFIQSLRRGKSHNILFWCSLAFSAIVIALIFTMSLAIKNIVVKTFIIIPIIMLITSIALYLIDKWSEEKILKQYESTVKKIKES